MRPQHACHSRYLLRGNINLIYCPISKALENGTLIGAVRCGAVQMPHQHSNRAAWNAFVRSSIVCVSTYVDCGYWVLTTGYEITDKFYPVFCVRVLFRMYEPTR